MKVGCLSHHPFQPGIHLLLPGALAEAQERLSEGPRAQGRCHTNTPPPTRPLPPTLPTHSPGFWEASTARWKFLQPEATQMAPLSPITSSWGQKVCPVPAPSTPGQAKADPPPPTCRGTP